MGRGKQITVIQDAIHSAIMNESSKIGKKRAEKLATTITRTVNIELLSKTQLKIYTSIGKLQSKYPNGVYTADIAAGVKLSAHLVASHLTHLFNKTTLLEVNYEGRNRLWRQK